MERQPLRRRRPALSCLPCRRRKIKCNRNNPCSHCVSTKTQCLYRVYSNEPPARKQRSMVNPSPTGPSLSTPVQQPCTNRTITEHDDRSPGSRAETPSDETTARIQSSGPPILGHVGLGPPDRIQGPEPEPDVRSLLQRIQKLEDALTSKSICGLNDTGRDILGYQISSQDSQLFLNKTRVLRWSHWNGTGKEFATIMACYGVAIGQGDGTSFQSDETRALIVQIRALLQKCKDLARSIKIAKLSRCFPSSEPGLSFPSREVADSMVNSYLGSFESAHRILHIPTFLAEYQQYWDEPAGASTSSRFTILLVIGIGSSICRPGDLDPAFSSMIYRWVQAAQTWLSGPLQKDRLEIAGLQIHYLF